MQKRGSSQLTLKSEQTYKRARKKQENTLLQELSEQLIETA
jgi:hypothetical protein